MLNRTQEGQLNARRGSLGGSEILGSWAPCRGPAKHPVFASLCSGSTVDKPALEAAPAATREKIRSRFHGSHDLIHRLFVCISGATCGPGVGVQTLRSVLWGAPSAGCGRPHLMSAGAGCTS